MKVSNSHVLYICLILFCSCSEDTSGPDTTERKTQSGWQPMTSGSAVHLRGIWGSSESDVFAVGDGGTILRFDGGVWSPMTSSTTNDLVDVWGSASNDVFVTGDAGTILHYDGSDWTSVPVNVTDPIGRMWGAVDEDGYVQLFAIVAEGPTALLRLNSVSWYEIRRPVIPGIERMLDVTAIPNTYSYPFTNYLVLVGENGGVFEYDVTGDEWWVGQSGVEEDLVSVHGSSWFDMVAVGKSSTVIRHNGHEWVEVGGSTGGDWLAIGSRTRDDIFVSGASGNMSNYDFCSFDVMTSNTTAAINGLWGTMNGSMFAVGDGGTILRYKDAPKNPNCPDNVTISVSAGVAPEITWTPACNVSKIIVQGMDDKPHWFVAADGNTIEPGVAYGVTPDCAVELRPAAQDVEPGEIHRVSVIRSDAEGDVIVGMWNFTPTRAGWVGWNVPAARNASLNTRYAQELMLVAESSGNEPDIMTFHRVVGIPCDAYASNVRPVLVIEGARGPDGSIDEIWHYDFRAWSTGIYRGYDLVFDRVESEP